MTNPAFPFKNRLCSWPQIFCKHNIRYSLSVFYILMICVSVSACGILTEAPAKKLLKRADYPVDFGEFLSQNNAYHRYEELVYFLASHGAHEIVPVWQLLQQGSDWKAHGLPKYAIPPRERWNDMINTLVFLKYDLIPYIGPVKVLSGFRTPQYNSFAGGANQSRHLQFSALDLRPMAKIERSQLHGILQNRWSTLGKDYNLGLGLYSGTRFHVDTGGFRRW